MLLDTANLESMSPTRMQKNRNMVLLESCWIRRQRFGEIGCKIKKLGTFILHETF